MSSKKDDDICVSLDYQYQDDDNYNNQQAIYSSYPCDNINNMNENIHDNHDNINSNYQNNTSHEEIINNNPNENHINMENYIPTHSNTHTTQINKSNPFQYTDTENIKTYLSSNKLYGLSFQSLPTGIRLGTSTIETNTSINSIEIINFENNKLSKTASIETEFPCTKLLFSPNTSTSNLFATTSDVLRLYKYNHSENKITLNHTLSKKHSQSYSGPLTSLDWNKVNPSILGVCSIDTTCTIWDVQKGEVKTSLIAHDKEVYDICFGQEENTFLTTGADGSVRLFDLRALDTCSILFDTQDNSPITRIAWNLNNNNFVAALGLDKNVLYIIDQRIPNSPYAFLSYHTNVVNAVTWAPNSNAYICSVGDDKNALIWDIQLISNKTEDPVMSYNAEFEIDNVAWCERNDEWIAIVGGNALQLLKVK